MIKDIIRLDYQVFGQSIPTAARQSILQVLKTQRGDWRITVVILNITRSRAYGAIQKKEAGDLKDVSRASTHVHNKTNKGKIYGSSNKSDHLLVN